MRTFDVTLKGFDGGTDKTDHLVKWVRAETREMLDLWLDIIGVKDSVESITDIGHHATVFDDGINVKLVSEQPELNDQLECRRVGNFFQITKKPTLGLMIGTEWAIESSRVISQQTV